MSSEDRALLMQLVEQHSFKCLIAAFVAEQVDDLGLQVRRAITAEQWHSVSTLNGKIELLDDLYNQLRNAAERQ